MKKPIEELVITFDGDMSGLYVVIDTTTNIEVAAPFPLKNDVLAVEAFRHLLADQKDKKAAYSHYVLRKVAEYSHIKHVIFEPLDEYDIISDDEDIDDYMNKIVDLVRKNEE